MTTFARTFDYVLRQANISPNRVATWTGLDPGYISRLRSGDRQNPSRDVVLTIGMALFRGSPEIETWHIDELLDSAGFAKIKKRGQAKSWPTEAA